MLRTLDMFCGSGGLSEGLDASGNFQTVWYFISTYFSGIDLNTIAQRTFNENFKDALALNIDCSKFILKLLEKDYSIIPQPVALSANFSRMI